MSQGNIWKDPFARVIWKCLRSYKHVSVFTGWKPILILLKRIRIRAGTGSLVVAKIFPDLYIYDTSWTNWWLLLKLQQTATYKGLIIIVVIGVFNSCIPVVKAKLIMRWFVVAFRWRLIGSVRFPQAKWYSPCFTPVILDAGWTATLGFTIVFYCMHLLHLLLRLSLNLYYFTCKSNMMNCSNH